MILEYSNGELYCVEKRVEIPHANARPLPFSLHKFTRTYCTGLLSALPFSTKNVTSSFTAMAPSFDAA